MSAEVIHESLGRGSFDGQYLEALAITRKRRLQSVDSPDVRNRLHDVLDVPHVMRELSATAIEQTMNNWSFQTKDDVFQYIMGHREDVDEEALIEVDTSLKQAMAEVFAEQHGGYGMATEYTVPEPVLIPMDGSSWKAHGACLESSNIEIFFPEEVRGHYLRMAIDAVTKRVCGGCDVQFECREAASEGDEPYGTWGGLTSDQRDALKQRVR